MRSVARTLAPVFVVSFVLACGEEPPTAPVELESEVQPSQVSQPPKTVFPPGLIAQAPTTRIVPTEEFQRRLASDPVSVG